MFVFKDKQYSHIACDVESCEAVSPDAKTLIENHGLVGLGWYATGGKHRCPIHYDAVDATT